MILYFSGTGNSRFVANELGKQLNDEVVSLNDYLKKHRKGFFESQTPFVFVTPSYMSRMPMRVEKYLLQAVFKGNKNAYFVFTAGEAIGNAGKYCKKICEKRALNYRGIQGIKMPANYVVMYDVLDRDKAYAAAQNALPAIEKVAGMIQNGGELQEQEMQKNKSFSAIAPAFTAMMVKSKKFYAEDTCVSCGKCKEVCPMNCISYKNGKPIWGENCMHCMACIGACPVKAIQYGKGTKKKHRYYLEEQ